MKCLRLGGLPIHQTHKSSPVGCSTLCHCHGQYPPICTNKQNGQPFALQLDLFWNHGILSNSDLLRSPGHQVSLGSMQKPEIPDIKCWYGVVFKVRPSKSGEFCSFKTYLCLTGPLNSNEFIQASFHLHPRDGKKRHLLLHIYSNFTVGKIWQNDPFVDDFHGQRSVTRCVQKQCVVPL